MQRTLFAEDAIVGQPECPLKKCNLVNQFMLIDVSASSAKTMIRTAGIRVRSTDFTATAQETGAGRNNKFRVPEREAANETRANLARK